MSAESTPHNEPDDAVRERAYRRGMSRRHVATPYNFLSLDYVKIMTPLAKHKRIVPQLAALFLTDLIGLRGEGANADGWFFCTPDDFHKTLGWETPTQTKLLSYLRDRGLIELAKDKGRRIARVDLMSLELEIDRILLSEEETDS